MIPADRRSQPVDVGCPTGCLGRLPDCRLVGSSQRRPWLNQRATDCHYARQADPRAGKASRQRQVAREARRQLPHHWTAGGDHQFRAGIEATAGVVERVDCRLGLEVAVPSPVDPGKQMPQKGRHVMGIKTGSIGPVHDAEVLRQRQLSLPEDGGSLGEQFGRPG